MQDSRRCELRVVAARVLRWKCPHTVIDHRNLFGREQISHLGRFLSANNHGVKAVGVCPFHGGLDLARIVRADHQRNLAAHEGHHRFPCGHDGFVRPRPCVSFGLAEEFVDIFQLGATVPRLVFEAFQ